MNESRHFTSRIAVVLATATLVGASAFADSRHPKTTDSRGGERATLQRDRAQAPAPVRAGHNVGVELHPVLSDRAERAGGGDDRHSASYGGGHGKRMPYYAHGRISKVHPYGNGYRIWVAGSPYPFFVPAAYYHQGHFNVGLTVRVGGYYNPRGYYDYYGDYECSSIADERLRGVVESIDHRRGELVLRLAGRGGFITVRMPERFERIWDGAYVVVYGDWNRWGRFVANDIDVIDDDYRW